MDRLVGTAGRHDDGGGAAHMRLVTRMAVGISGTDVAQSRADSSGIIARAMEAVVQWTGSSELQDDMTMVVARRI
jgi:hypothetical protein